MTARFRWGLAWIGCVAMTIAAIDSPVSAQFGLFKRGKSPNYQIFRDPAGRFLIEYPAKDWRVIPVGGSVVASVAQKDGEAAVLVDYTKLKLALAPEEIDEGFANLELSALKEKEPTAKDVKATVVTAPSGPRVVIDYVRTGASGPERVTQYSIPAGADLYRVICTVRAALHEKYQPTMTYVVDSFSLLRRQG